MPLPVILAVVLLVVTATLVVVELSGAAARGWLLVARELDPRASRDPEPRLVLAADLLRPTGPFAERA